MKYTVDDILAKAKAMEAWNTTTEVEDFAIKREFDPRGMSYDNWLTYAYPTVKLFFRDMNKEEFKESLDEHRKLYDERDHKRLSLKRDIPEMFEYFGTVVHVKNKKGNEKPFFVEVSRLFPLKEEKYRKAQKRFQKKKKIINAVLMFGDNELIVIEKDSAEKICMSLLGKK